MALSNAERQKRWRERRNALAALSLRNGSSVVATMTGHEAREELERKKQARAQAIMRKSSVRRPPNYKTVAGEVEDAFDCLDQYALELLQHGVSAQELAERIKLLLLVHKKANEK